MDVTPLAGYGDAFRVVGTFDAVVTQTLLRVQLVATVQQVAADHGPCVFVK